MTDNPLIHNGGVFNTFEVRIYKDKKVKDYQLSAMETGKLWLANQEGEGMEVDGVKFYELLDKFWKENY